VDIAHSSKSIFNFPRVVDISNTENHVIARNINNNISTIATRLILGALLILEALNARKLQLEMSN
jgi:hypothetical protein